MFHDKRDFTNYSVEVKIGRLWMQAQCNHMNPIKIEYFQLAAEEKIRDSSHEEDLTWEGGSPLLRRRNPGGKALTVAPDCGE